MASQPGPYSAASLATSPADYAACEYIESFLQQAHAVRQQREPEWEEQWANYTVEPYTKNQVANRQADPYGNDQRRYGVGELKTTESHQIANTLTASLLGSLYGVRDYIQAAGNGIEDQDAGARVSQLLMYGLERPGNYRAQYETLKDGIIFSTGTYKTGWETRVRTVPRRLPVAGPDGQPVMDPETGQPISIMQNVQIPVYDDPRIYPCSIYDIWHDPSATRISDSVGVLERFRIGRDDLALNANDPAWNRDGIINVLTNTQPGGRKPVGPGTDSSPKLLIDQLSEDDVRGIKAFGYFGGWAYSGMLPSEVAGKLGLDPLASAKLAIVNGYVVQATQNPERSAQVPYGTITILPTGGSIYGLSPLRVVRYLQDVSDTQMILTVQAAIESVYQNYVTGGLAGVGPGFARQLERRKPREVFTVSGDITQIAPLAKDYTGLQMAMTSLSMLSQTMRDASNARDPVQGIQSNDRSTATEINTVTSAALQNVNHLGVLIERDELPRLGSLIHGLYYVNLPDEGAVAKRVGNPASVPVSLADIDADYDITFIGAQQAITKQQKAREFNEFMQILMATPMGQASTDLVEAAKWYANNAMDTKGLERLIISDPNEVIARMQIMGMKPPAPSGAEPEGPPGGPPA